MSAGAMSLFALTETEALALAGRGGTPCFAYRLDIARSRYDALRAVLPARAILAYAVKANPGPRLMEAFAAKGASLDCASIGELELARAASVPGSRVLLAGPGKSDSELRLALDMGARIQADGIEDFERLEAILAAGPEADTAGARSTAVPVNLRVQPASGISEVSRIIGGSGPSAFGVDEEDLPAFLEDVSRFKRVTIAGATALRGQQRKERRATHREPRHSLCHRRANAAGLRHRASISSIWEEAWAYRIGTTSPSSTSPLSARASATFSRPIPGSPAV